MSSTGTTSGCGDEEAIDVSRREVLVLLGVSLEPRRGDRGVINLPLTVLARCASIMMLTIFGSVKPKRQISKLAECAMAI